MYMETPEDARAFALALRRKARAFPSVDIFLAPPFPFLAEIAEVLVSSSVRVGAQAVSAYDAGAHTGDVSATMLKKIGAQFAIVGHSERRALGDTNDMVRAQLGHTAEAGLTPILCIGEREREADGEHFSFIEAQLSSALDKCEPRLLKKLVIAYEPVWAIGKSATDAMKPADLEEMVIYIRKMLTDLIGRRLALRVPILYGGSVESANAAELLKEGGVGGFLVGHASADLEGFLSILKTCK